MRILFFSSIFPHAHHRVKGTFNLELCRTLARQHDVQVISPRSFIDCWKYPQSAANRALSDAWLTRTFGLQTHYPTYYYLPKIGRRWFGEAMWWSVQSCLQATLREFRPDAIVSYWAHPDGEVGLRAARQEGIPCVVKVGGSDVLLLTQSPSRRKKVRRVLQESDAVTTVSDGLREKVIELGVVPERVTTIYQGVDPNLFFHGDKRDARKALNLPQDRKVLLWVGRMVDVKGLEVLIAAADQLRRHVPDVLLFLVGDGERRDAVLNDIRKRHLEQHVQWVGAQPQQQLPDWYRAADVVCLSSWSEGLPNVLREALACGRPFVSTDVGSVREIADAHGGLPFAELVPAGDHSAMADALEQVLQETYQLAAEMVPCRTWTECADELVQLLRRLRGETSPGVITTPPANSLRLATSGGNVTPMKECLS